LARRNERCGIGAGRCFPKLQQKSDEAAAVEERFVEQALGILELLRFLLPLVIW
jgi:hypothetical protein